MCFGRIILPIETNESTVFLLKWKSSKQTVCLHFELLYFLKYDVLSEFLTPFWFAFCVGVMYSSEYDTCDVTLSVYPHRASLKNMPVHDGNRTYDLASPLTVLELEYLADLSPCARCLVFKLHFSYFLNMCLKPVFH